MGKELVEQIEACEEIKLETNFNHPAVHKEHIQWDVLRFEVISLCAKAANFKVTREKQTQDTLSTTVIKPHELGTKWTKSDVDSLISNIDVVRADTQMACREIRRISHLFSNNMTFLTFEHLCECFKETIKQLQMQHRGPKIKKLEKQLSTLSKEVEAEESRLATFGPEEYAVIIQKMEQRVQHMNTENKEQRAFLESSRSNLLTSQEDALLQSLPQLRQQLQVVEADLKQMQPKGREDRKQTKTTKKTKPSAFKIHNVVSILD